MNIDKTLGKWFLAILVVILLFDRISFSEIKRVIRPITNKVLANRLKALEGFGLLVKRIVVEHPLRVEYYLTDKGRRFAQDIAALVGLDKGAQGLHSVYRA